MNSKTNKKTYPAMVVAKLGNVSNLTQASKPGGYGDGHFCRY